MMMKSSLRSKGFTLIEVLISLVILSVALLGLAGLMVQTTKNNSYGGLMTEAATFAQDKFEEMRAIGWLKINHNTTTIDNPKSSTGVNYTRRVVTKPINANLTEINITINWTDRINHSIRFLSTLSE
jgi:type IV pilus assembly protein PilV